MQANAGGVYELKSTQRPRLRILCIHSFRTSAKIFKQQLDRSRIFEQLADEVELVFLDAPHPASGPIPRDVKPYFEGPYYEWFTAEVVGDHVEFDEPKMESSVRYLQEALSGPQGPFDGVMGFSQGAALSGVLCALQAKAAGSPAARGVPPLRFCVLFAGIKSSYPPHALAYGGGKVRLPSLHVFGDKDQLKQPHCIELADAFESSVTIMHPKGHVVPQLQGPQLAVAHAFVRHHLAAKRGDEAPLLPSPCSGPAPAPAPAATAVPASGEQQQPQKQLQQPLSRL